MKFIKLSILTLGLTAMSMNTVQAGSGSAAWASAKLAAKLIVLVAKGAAAVNSAQSYGRH